MSAGREAVISNLLVLSGKKDNVFPQASSLGKTPCVSQASLLLEHQVLRLVPILLWGQLSHSVLKRLIKTPKANGMRGEIELTPACPLGL